MLYTKHEEILSSDNVKQVIVFRKDLLKGEHAIRKGKFAAQCCHASLGALLKYFEKSESGNAIEYQVAFEKGTVLDKWLNGIFTKICLSVDNEEQLLELKKKCDDMCIANALITDAGCTEFHGVPTVTCLGIGPHYSEIIDQLTGNLSLL